MRPLKAVPPKPTVYFVSGHLDLTPEEFQLHYVPVLELALQKAPPGGVRFVVGDAPGCDLMAQAWFFQAGLEYRVFHMLEAPRNNFGREWQRGSADNLTGGFPDDETRDAAMTDASDHDIAWVRPSKKTRKSGTQKNLDRRREQKRARRIAERATWPKGYIEELGDDGRPYLCSDTPTWADRVVPLPPGYRERYESARAEWARIRGELGSILAEAEDLGDATTLIVPNGT